MLVFHLLCVLLGFICLPTTGVKGTKIIQENSSISGFNHFSPGRFRPFYVTTRSVDKCNATRVLDAERCFDYKVTVVKISRYVEEYRGYFILPKDVQLRDGHIRVTLIRGGSQLLPLFEKFTTNFCEDMFFMALANMFLKPDANCVVRKGNYTIAGVNVDELSHILTGKYFILETVKIILEAFSKRGSLFCYQTILESKELRTKKIVAPKTPSTPKTKQIQP